MKVKLELAVIFLVTVLLTLSLTPPTFAQSVSCNPQTGKVNEGLISAQQNISPNFSNTTGQCVLDNQAAFLPFDIATYASLKSAFCTLKGDLCQPLTTLNFSSAGVYYNPNPQNPILINANPTGNSTAIVFTDGDIDINSDITYGNNITGLVLVSGKNINIDPSVKRIDAVLISSGKIYTAGVGCSKSSITTSPLNVNGSIISLNTNPADNPAMVFCRNLTDNSQPAEVVTFQTKYLVILKDLFSTTAKFYNEIVQ
ncbi:hypothetical protein HY389_01950 [Candidatus Daviesbacteria bacterium]|nr:hypothetical protein [Candidatus Daviesbacteria bacterium]